jgi:RNA polymerase sigma factor (TIGR02999 family)
MTRSSSSDLQALLQAADAGEPAAIDAVVALLYDELRRLAHSRLRRTPGSTLLDTTSLVHEAYLRFQRNQAIGFASRHQFLSYAAKVMRGIVVDAIRARMADRRGGDAVLVTLNTAVGDGLPAGDAQVLQVHEALEQLAGVDARLARVVEMRYFGGLSEVEMAGCLGVTERTVQRDWQKARLLLAGMLRSE